jgi:hypothetical protein
MLGIYWNFHIAVPYGFGICKRCNCDDDMYNGSWASGALYVNNFRIMNQSLACTVIWNTSSYTWRVVTYISGEEILFSIFLFIYEVKGFTFRKTHLNTYSRQVLKPHGLFNQTQCHLVNRYSDQPYRVILYRVSLKDPSGFKQLYIR